MAASVTVRYYTNEVTTNRQGYPLRIVAVNAVDMPKEIFVFQRIVPQAMDPQENAQGDIFIKIADPSSFEEYPTEPPGPDSENPYYRKDEVLLLFQSYDELVETKGLIDTCITALVLALKAAEITDEMEEVTYD